MSNFIKHIHLYLYFLTTCTWLRMGYGVCTKVRLIRGFPPFYSLLRAIGWGFYTRVNPAINYYYSFLDLLQCDSLSLLFPKPSRLEPSGPFVSVVLQLRMFFNVQNIAMLFFAMNGKMHFWCWPRCAGKNKDSPPPLITSWAPGGGGRTLGISLTDIYFSSISNKVSYVTNLLQLLVKSPEGLGLNSAV